MKIKVFLWMVCICFVGSVIGVGLVKADVSVGITTSIGNSTGSANLNAYYHSKSADDGRAIYRNKYFCGIRGIDGENTQITNFFSKEHDSALTTGTDIKFIKQSGSMIGSLDAKEKINVGVVAGAKIVGDSEGEYFDAAAYSGLEVTETEFHSIGSTEQGSETSVNYFVDSPSGKGKIETGLEGKYQKYKETADETAVIGLWGEPPCIIQTAPHWVKTEDTETSYHFSVSGGSYQGFTSNYTMGVNIE